MAATHRIDVHHHFLPQRYMAEEHARVAGYTHGNMSADRLLHWTPEQALEVMDQHGIEVAIGSGSTPGVWFGDVAAARRLSRDWNEVAARAAHDHPTRFGFFGMVAPPDIDGALKETEYALDILKADGIGLLSNYDGKSLGDPSFAPLFAELNRRKCVVYVHPTVHPCCAGLIPGLIPQGIEFPLDTTRTITSLLVSGTFARNPDISFIFAHGGGTLPFLAHRIAEVTGRVKAFEGRNPLGATHELKKLYCDTASAASGPQLAAMMAFFQHSHILFGSDYPFVQPPEAIEGLAHHPFTVAMRHAIDRDNALALLPRWKKA
ncbi:MAG TPA: amidohydrolase family protein [Stellaceae bacterium]|nr:amidohydrolase family protein [Stellaceae bacterium]